VNQPLGLKRPANRADPSILHIGGRNNVDAAPGLCQGLISQYLDGFIVEDSARIINQAILPMAGVRIQGNVGHDSDLGHMFF